jgi:hypothetical protein
MPGIQRIAPRQGNRTLGMLIGRCFKLYRAKRWIAAFELRIQIPDLNDKARLDPKESRPDEVIGLKHLEHVGAGLGCSHRVQSDLNLAHGCREEDFRGLRHDGSNCHGFCRLYGRLGECSSG